MKNTKYKILNTIYTIGPARSVHFDVFGKRRASATSKSTAGFVSLFAVLISLVILAITIGISTVAFKENVLAFSAREGSYAFFAADTGLECALYHDSEGVFLLPDGTLASNPIFDCAGLSIISNTDSIDTAVNFQFDIDMAGRPRCVEVSVKKAVDVDDPANPGNTISATQIYSNGYNVGCGDLIDISNIRAVNRLLIATYPNPIPLTTP